jgi:hypothetical protein
MFYLIPPAGMPISFCDILKITSSWLGSDFCAEMFEEKIKSHAGVRYCYFLKTVGKHKFLIFKA